MTTRTERLNLRCSEQTLLLLRSAAELQDQDLTSFILGAAIDRARAVLTEDRLLRLAPVEVDELEQRLAAEATVVPQLRRLVAKAHEDRGSEPTPVATR